MFGHDVVAAVWVVSLLARILGRPYRHRRLNVCGAFTCGCAARGAFADGQYDAGPSHTSCRSIFFVAISRRLIEVCSATVTGMEAYLVEVEVNGGLGRFDYDYCCDIRSRN